MEHNSTVSVGGPGGPGRLEASNASKPGRLEASNASEPGRLEASNASELGGLEASNVIEPGRAEASNASEPSPQSQQVNQEGLCKASSATLNMSMSPFDMLSYTDITLEEACKKLEEIRNDNMFLKENMAKNTIMVREQYDKFASLRKTDKYWIDQYKTVIASQKEKIMELSVKTKALEDKEKKHEEERLVLQNANAHLLRLKVLNEQRIFKIVKEAEMQGVKRLDETGSELQMTDTVYVATEDKEKEIEKLEASNLEMESTIGNLRNEVYNVNCMKASYKTTNDSLLKDLDGFQTQKRHMDNEIRRLQDENLRLTKVLDQQMQSNLTTTRKEIESQLHSACFEEQIPTGNANDTLSCDRYDSLRYRDGQKASLQLQEDVKNLQRQLHLSEIGKRESEQKLEEVTQELQEVESQYKLVQERMESLEDQKTKLSVEFEENLSKLAYQKQENMMVENAKLSEDQEALRAQLVSVLNQVDDLNQRLSAAHLAVTQKDRRINELTEVNSEWKEEYDKQCNQYNQIIQGLRVNLRQQEHVSQHYMAQNNDLKHQHSELQDSFHQLVNDYQVALDMIDAEKSKQNSSGGFSEQSKVMADELNQKAAQVFAAEEAIKFRDRQLEEIKRKLIKKEEDITLLRIQMETYEEDFKKERIARTELANKCNELAEELRFTQERMKSMNPPQMNQGKMASFALKKVRQKPHPQPHLQIDANNTGHYNYNQPYINQESLSPQGAVGYNQGFQPDDENADHYPSLVTECPFCSLSLPDQDSLELHVADHHPK